MTTLPAAMTCPECRGSRYVESYRSNWGNLSASDDYRHIGTDPCETCRSGTFYPSGLVDIEIHSDGVRFEGDGPYTGEDLEHHLSGLLLDEGLISFSTVARVLQEARSYGCWAGWSDSVQTGAN